MNIERRAKDYEQRVKDAGGTDALILGMVKAIKQTRRVQYLMVGGLIFLLGLAVVLGLTVVSTNKIAKMAIENTERSEENRTRSLNNAKQGNDIVRCLTKRKRPGTCLGLSVKPGTPGSAGLRGISGTPGLSGPPGARGEAGQTGRSGMNGLSGRAGPVGPQGLPGEAGKNGTQGMDGRNGESGQPGEDGTASAQGAQGVPGPAGPVGPTGPVGPAPTRVICSAPGPDGTQSCTVP